MIARTLSTALLLGMAGTALAGPAGDQAKMHFQAIAAGQVEQILSAYDANSRLQWVGGPLDGAYAGNDQLRDVWSKFAKAQGPLDHKVNNVQENANPKGTTVTANVEFMGKTTIKVRYVLTYRDGKIANEVWQIDPNLGTALSQDY